MMIRVTSEELTNVSGALRSGSAEIDSRLASMLGRVQTLVDQGWQGAASQQFATLYQEWSTSAAHLRQALDGIAALLANAATAYADTERSIQQSMSQG